MKNKFTSIDLFAGVGGLSLGLQNAGFQTLFANEFDSEIGESFQNNFKDTISESLYILNYYLSYGSLPNGYQNLNILE